MINVVMWNNQSSASGIGVSNLSSFSCIIVPLLGLKKRKIHLFSECVKLTKTNSIMKALKKKRS